MELDEGLFPDDPPDTHTKSKALITRAVGQLLMGQQYRTSLDGDVGGPDHRPGRGAIILDALVECLGLRYGTRDAANMLVLSAVRAAAAFEQRQREQRGRKRAAKQALQDEIAAAK